MKQHIAGRVLACAEYMLKTGSTVRGCAEWFGISKTTVHKDMRARLPLIDAQLAQAVDGLLDVNRKQRHMRGGQATKLKYKKMGTMAIRPP